jgi:pimeloyl-ACP methyl ester carboxylesterase
MAATQKPISGAIFGEPSGAAGWNTIPFWYIVSKEDHAINPDLERFFANRMNATITELDSSHVPFISQPAEVVKIIEDAAVSLNK